jgi:hypothetical protein
MTAIGPVAKDPRNWFVEFRGLGVSLYERPSSARWAGPGHKRRWSHRPHSAHRWLTPVAFAEAWRVKHESLQVA